MQRRTCSAALLAGVLTPPRGFGAGSTGVALVASNLAALCIFASQGLVLWRISLPMAAANALGAVIGARFALSKGDRLVRAVVLVVVCAVILKLVVDMTRG